jgi:hypothetical protein
MISQGDQVRNLFQGATESVSIIAPYIKVNSLKRIIDIIADDVFIKCVTRWIPEEVAAGVSDPEIIQVLDERGNSTITLVDKLHAKIYIADEKCLAGSANVTQPGLGESAGDNNIEVLVGCTTQDQNIINTLNAISQVERTAKLQDAEKVRRLADSLKETITRTEHFWFPKSKKAERAFQLYNAPLSGFISNADKILVNDIESANIIPALNEPEFNEQVRSLLNQIPLAKSLLSGARDMVLTQADALPFIHIDPTSEFTKHDLWQSFVSWMAYFYSDFLITQEITEIALRRAQEIST